MRGETRARQWRTAGSTGGTGGGVIRYRDVGRLVPTNCDAYEAFFPMLLRPFQYGARLFGTRFVDLLAGTLRMCVAQRALVRTVSLTQVDDATLDANMGPLIQDPGARHDLKRFLASVSNRYTLGAARKFAGFDRPVLIAWGLSDFFFSPRLALRLQHDFPLARLEAIPGSRAFVPEDRPRQLAELIQEFSRQGESRAYGGS